MEAARGDTPEAMQLVREGVVSGLVRSWASTSNDSSAEALAIQQAAIDEFGLKGTSEWHPRGTTNVWEKTISDETKEEYEQNGDLYRGFLRSMYNNTQDALKREGVSEVTLHRGVRGGQPSETAFMDRAYNDQVGYATKPYQEETTVSSRPLSSWASDRSTAEDFTGSEHYDGVVYSVTAPASRVLSTPITGNGALNENEFVLLGGTDQQTISTGRFP